MKSILLTCEYLFYLLSLTLFFSHNTALAETPEVIIATSTGYPPYYYQTDDNKLSGICVDIIDRVAEKLEIKIVYKQYPWKRMLLSAEKGEIDAVFPLFKTVDREKKLDFGDLVLAFEEVIFFVNKNSPLNSSEKIDEVFNFPIGVVDGYSYGEYFDSKKDIKKVVTQSDYHLMTMFKHRRFEVGIGNRYVVMYNSLQQGIEKDVSFLEPPLTREPLYLAFSKKSKNTHLLDRFDEELRKLRESGEYVQIFKLHGMQN